MAKIPSEDGTMPEPPARVEIPAEDKPAEEAATPEVPAPEEEGDLFQLDPDEPTAINPEAFDNLLTQKPELKALLEADPELKEMLFATSRAAEELKPFKALFPDVKSAEFARENAASFVDVQNTFLGSTTPEGAAATLGKIAELCYERDEQGNIAKDQAGNPIIGDDFFGFLDHTVKADIDHRFGEIEAILTANNFATPEEKEHAETVHAALSVLRDELSSQQKDPNAALPEELRERSAELDRREQALNSKQQTERVQDRVAFDRSVVDAGVTRMKDSINKIISDVKKQGAHLPEFVEKAVHQAMGQKLVQAMKDDPALVKASADLQRLPIGDASRTRRLEQIDKVIQDRLPAIARSVLRDAGVQTLKGSEAKRAKIAEQEKNSRSEPKGSAGSANPQPGQPMDENKAWDVAAAHWQKQNPGKQIDADAKGRIANLSVRVMLGQPLA